VSQGRVPLSQPKVRKILDTTLLWRVPRGAAYFDIRFNARAHSLSGSCSPSVASPIISLAIAIVARSLRSINPSCLRRSKAADMLAMSSGLMMVELARRVSSSGWVALCERRRAGFARLSGWQPVGNWAASAANFPASLLPVDVTHRDAQFAPKNGQKPKPIGWPVYTSSAHSKGRNHPPRWGSFFCRAGRRDRFLAPRGRGFFLE
jgi:hypothetical protein